MSQTLRPDFRQLQQRMHALEKNLSHLQEKLDIYLAKLHYNPHGAGAREAKASFFRLAQLQVTHQCECSHTACPESEWG